MKPARRPRSPSPVTHPLVFLLIGLHTVPAIGQPPTTVLDRASCNSCRIVRDVVLEFGAHPSAQEAAPDGLMAAMPVRPSQYLALRNSMGGPESGPILIGADGRVIRPLGPKGHGPGEFAGPGFAVRWRGDSLLVSDQLAGRISVFDPRLRYARSFPQSPGTETVVTLADGGIVVGESVDLRNPARQPLHLLDAAGRVLRSFGQTDDLGRAANRGEAPRLLASDGWMVRSALALGTYRITEWDPSTGRRLRTMARKGSLFPERKHGNHPTPSRPPEGGVYGLFYDASVLWVFYAVADKQWARGLGEHPIPIEGGGTMYPVVSLHGLYDTLVEAIEIPSGRLLASQRYDEFMVVFWSQGKLAVIPVETAEGEKRSRLARFTLLRR